MKIVFLKNNPDINPSRRLPALLLAVLVTFSACSGSNNTSSTPTPLPNGLNGSLKIYNSNLAGCYATTTTSSSPYLSLCTATTTPSPAGSNGVTALNTFGTTSPGLVVGTTNGVVSVVNNVYGSSPTPISCTTLGPSSSISAVAVAGANIFAAVGGKLYEFPSSTNTCTTPSSVSISSGVTGLAVAPNGTLFGVTSAGRYFSIASASSINTLPPTISLTLLPNYPISSPVINGMAIDPNGLVFFADASSNTSNNGGQITIYNVSGNNLVYNGQSYSGNNNGVAISDPIGIAVSETSITNSNYCSTGSCDYIYLLNNGNIIQQYVMPVPNPPTSGVSINPFNLPYTGCEMTNPIAITSFPNLTGTTFTTPGQTGPFVFLGNNGLYSAGTCRGQLDYGNNVVSYGIIGQ